MSDNVAADALFELVTPRDVMDLLGIWGLTGLSIRHGFGGRNRMRVGGPARGDLDGPSRGGLHGISGAPVPPDVAARTRELMAANIHRQRLAPDLHSDASRWFSKTGPLLNLRHEVGVVEHADGGPFAIAAVTESRIAAAFQPHVESVMGHVALRLRDHLR
jgi:beta-lactamase class A